jgi:hypothetical protein
LGEVVAATFTAGSTSVTWSGGLTVSGLTSLGYVDVHQTFANRALPSNVSYTNLDGVPIEVCMALCNTINASCWLNIPLTYSDSDIESLSNLVINGTGITSGYSALSAGLNFYVELANENWNGGNASYTVCGILGYIEWNPQSGSPSINSYSLNWQGMRSAQMAADVQTALGSSFSRAIPVINCQAGSTAGAEFTLAASFWTTGTGPPSSYPIKKIAIAPYFGANPSSGDCTTMLGVATPLDDFFATLYSNTGTSANGSHVYSSIPTNGWLGATQTEFIQAYLGIMSSYPSQQLVAYEGGQGFSITDSGTATGWAAMLTTAERDSRMGTAYTNYLNYWKNNVGATTTNINILYTDISPLNPPFAWGALENVMQTISPLTSAPPKFQAIQNFIG